MKRKVSLGICIVGIVLFLVGIFTSVPGTELTTYKALDGEKSSYTDERYSAIEEYVGGDAYNYIIGASLVGGRIAGAKAQKAIFISAGLLIASLGALSYVYSDDKKKASIPEHNAAPRFRPENPAACPTPSYNGFAAENMQPAQPVQPTQPEQPIQPVQPENNNQ